MCAYALIGTKIKYNLISCNNSYCEKNLLSEMLEIGIHDVQKNTVKTKTF